MDYKKHTLQNPLIQWSYRRQYEAIIKELAVCSTTSVLDIGSGLGFLKPLIQAKGATYTGIEPDTNSFNAAVQIYGTDGYIHGYFPDALPDSNKFNIIILLTCLDEITQKESVLNAIKSKLTFNDGVCYIAVRNNNFILNKLKTPQIMKNKKGRHLIKDLTTEEWEKLLTETGFLIHEKGKFWRPWVTEISLIGLKNILYKLLTMTAPYKYSYMVHYKVYLSA